MTDRNRSPLATTEQKAAEELALAALADRRVHEAMDLARKQMLNNSAAGDAEGKASLERDLKIWAASLALRHANGNVTRPHIVMDADPAARDWFGHAYPTAQVAADNPNNVYRNAYIDGAHAYRLIGQINEPRPAQFVVEVTISRPGGMFLEKGSAEKVDMGGQTAILTDRDIKPDADGRFTVTFDVSPASGRPHHLQIADCQQSILVRDTLSDWRQVPLTVSIERVDDAPSTPELTVDDIAASTAKDLAPWIAFWTLFKENWMGSPAPNQQPEPKPRDGGWGFASAAPYRLSDDEALLLTISDGGAPYYSIHVLDRWLIAEDPRFAFINLNPAQTARNPDGTITYILSTQDPGAANWLSTGGQRQGYIFLRWQGTPPDVRGADLLLETRVVKLKDVSGPVSPEQRAAMLKNRRSDYESRFKDR